MTELMRSIISTLNNCKQYVRDRARDMEPIENIDYQALKLLKEIADLKDRIVKEGLR